MKAYAIATETINDQAMFDIYRKEIPATIVPYGGTFVVRGGNLTVLTKAALRAAAIRELNISKNSFDSAWIAAIEDSGRHDWYEPMRRQPRTRQ